MEKLKAQRETMAFSGIKLQAFRAAPAEAGDSPLLGPEHVAAGCRGRSRPRPWTRPPSAWPWSPCRPTQRWDGGREGASGGHQPRQKVEAQGSRTCPWHQARRRRWSPWHSPRTRSHAEEEPKESTSSTSVRFAFLQFIQYQRRKFAVGKPIGSQELPSKLLNPDVFGEWAGLHRILSGGR